MTNHKILPPKLTTNHHKPISDHPKSSTHKGVTGNLDLDEEFGGDMVIGVKR